MFDGLEVAFGREQAPLEVNPDDGFIATTWWTAHIARDALRALAPTGAREEPRFLYLIQEYEPFTFPMGTYAALAQESYAAPHFGLFSSELLRDYFRRHRIGVFASGRDGDALSASFENAITAVPPPTVAELAARRSRRLLFYARPEPHAARNLFELGVVALSRALARGTLPGDWELDGIGSLAPETSVPLGSGARAAAAAADEPGRLRAGPARPRRRPGPDVHPASQSRADRDGLGRDADGHQHVREQDERGAARDLRQPARGTGDG